jgi:hypothetical protein
MNSKLQKELFGIINSKNFIIKDSIFKKKLKNYLTTPRQNNSRTNTRKARSLTSRHIITEILANETMRPNIKKILIHAAARNIYNEGTLNETSKRRNLAIQTLKNALKDLSAASRSRTRSRKN